MLDDLSDALDAVREAHGNGALHPATAAAILALGDAVTALATPTPDAEPAPEN